MYELLVTAGQIASQLSMRVFVVGGFVRDLLLNIPNQVWLLYESATIKVQHLIFISGY